MHGKRIPKPYYTVEIKMTGAWYCSERYIVYKLVKRVSIRGKLDVQYWIMSKLSAGCCNA